MTFRRRLNGLEFCYRTLVDRLGFDPEAIQVLTYDGSLRTFGDPQDVELPLWPGDATPYRLRPSGEGTRSAFQHAVRTLSAKLTEDDQVFINTTGHGGHH